MNEENSSSTRPPITKAIKIKVLCKKTGCSPQTIWRWQKLDPNFPQPRYYGRDRVWDEAEFDAYLEQKHSNHTVNISNLKHAGAQA